MTIDRTKLAKVLAMLSSSHDGEVLAAAHKATGMMRDADLTWPELLGDGPIEAAPLEPWEPAPFDDRPWYDGYADEPEDEPSDIATHQTWAGNILAAGLLLDCLNDWERKFLKNISTWDKSLSDKQKETLRRTHAKVIRQGAEMGDMPL